MEIEERNECSVDNWAARAFCKKTCNHCISNNVGSGKMFHNYSIGLKIWVPFRYYIFKALLLGDFPNSMSIWSVFMFNF